MNTLASVILSALHDTRDMGLTVEERAEAIADAVRKHRRTSEPNAIALLREGVFVPNAVDCDHILAAYDAIVAERDAAIAECHEQARLNGMGSEREARLMSDQTRPLECDCCGGTWGYINAESDEHDNSFDCIAELTQQRDAAVRELAETRKREALSDAIVDECDSDITKLVQERATLRARLAACEKIVEAAKAYEKWMGKWHDYTVSCGDKPAKQQRALIDAVRAAVAAETTTTTKDTTL